MEQQLVQLVGPQISISTRAEDISIDGSINRITREENSDIIVIGASGKTGFEKYSLTVIRSTFSSTATSRY